MLNKLKTRRPQLTLRDLRDLHTLNTRAWWNRARTTLYTWAGFACIVVAAYTTIPQLGWLTAGLAFLTLEALGGKSNQSGQSGGGIP